MSETSETLARIVPSATPTDADIAAWQALPREEQLRRLQATLSHSDCSDVSGATMSEILKRAQSAAKIRHG